MLIQLFSDKSALIVATLVGMAMCSIGIGQVAARGLWLEPLTIISYVLGALVLVIAGAALLNIRLPIVDSTRTALVLVVMLALFKVALTQVHRAFA